MSDAQNVHPNIRFRILGYRGTRQDNLHIFPDGSFDAVKLSHPVGSEHDHLPPPPCRYELIFTGTRDELQGRRQQFCRLCYPLGAAEDNRMGAVA